MIITYRLWEDNRADVEKRSEYYTIDDIYVLPDGPRAELMDGQIHGMVPLGWGPQAIAESGIMQ